LGGNRPVGPGFWICRKYYLVMALPAKSSHPPGMFSPHLTRHDREFKLRRSRLPASVIGTAVLGVSLLLSVAPVLGAAGNGNGSSGGNGSGNVKVHDASTGGEWLGSDKEWRGGGDWVEVAMVGRI